MTDDPQIVAMKSALAATQGLLGAIRVPSTVFEGAFRDGWAARGMLSATGCRLQSDLPRPVAGKRGMPFNSALFWLKNGERIARADWYGRTWLALVTGRDWIVLGDGSPTGGIARIMGRNYRTRPWIGIKTADEAFVPWTASQIDLLAEDWEAVS